MSLGCSWSILGMGGLPREGVVVVSSWSLYWMLSAVGYVGPGLSLMSPDLINSRGTWGLSVSEELGGRGLSYYCCHFVSLVEVNQAILAWSF